jgi:hypothetical protein
LQLVSAAHRSELELVLAHLGLGLSLVANVTWQVAELTVWQRRLPNLNFHPHFLWVGVELNDPMGSHSGCVEVRLVYACVR